MRTTLEVTMIIQEDNEFYTGTLQINKRGSGATNIEYNANVKLNIQGENITEFMEKVARKVQRRGQLSYHEKVIEDIDNTKAITLPLFSNVEQAYASDNPALIADLGGKVSGNAAMEVATALIPTTEFTGLANASELT